MLMLEKSEKCPTCGEVKRWLYDAQLCAVCGHGDRFFHARAKVDACDHRFSGWRAHADGRGGEQFCRKCGMGAMEHTLRNDPT